MVEWQVIARVTLLIILLMIVPFLVEAFFDSRQIVRPNFGLVWSGVLAYGPIIAGATLICVGSFIWFDHKRQAGKIAELLSLAENDLNDLLRTWGEELAANAGRDLAKERSSWVQRDPRVGRQTAAFAKASLTAFLLRLVYQGQIEGARSKIIAVMKDKDRSPPYVAPGLSELVGMDQFEKTGVFSNARFSSRLIRLTVRRYAYPRDIRMVKTDPDGGKLLIKNWQVIEELTQQQA